MKKRWMPSGKTLAVGLIGLVVAAGSFGACASGGTGPGTGGAGAGGSPSTGTTGGAPPIMKGQLGSECKNQNECDIGKCTDLGDGKKYCSTECPPECPGGLYCGIVNGKSMCIPNKNLCDQCSDSMSCGFPSERCLVAPASDSFCAIDCTTDGICPNGFSCVNGDKYEKGNSGTGGGGTGGAGPGSSSSGSATASASASASASSGAGASGGAGGSGGSGPSTGATRFCVPNDGASCPCDDKRDGVSRTCEKKNANGSCAGTEVCQGSRGQFVGCSAATPKKESCNGKDDNCNDKIDEGDGNDLCSDMGAPPQHASWICKDAQCSLGPCDTGWTAYPSGMPAQGCKCQIDAKEPNDTCATATGGNTISDSGGTVQLTGTLSNDTDVDVYAVQVNDAAESGTNSYHVNIVFSEPAANTEFQMDVIRGATCLDSPAGPAVNITSYDWCVAGNNGNTANPVGLAPCGNVAGEAHCADVSSKYWVRVHRKAGATKTCSEYKVVVKANGGACDFTQTCM